MHIMKSDDFTEGAELLAATLTSSLDDNKRVLWLIPGGSNIGTSAGVMTYIPEELTKNLTVTLTDERFGPIGHPDSNWLQLAQAGFDPKSAKTVPILQKGLNLEQTIAHFEASLSALFSDNDIIIGQFGMGSDGHIAGILPNSPAAHTKSLAAGYETGTFTRITCTFQSILHCDYAFLFAFGEAKQNALQRLLTEQPVTDQPAQIIKQIPNVFVFNDVIGESE